MNKKAQVDMKIGIIIMIAIIAIVGTVLMTSSAQNLELYRNTHDVVNESFSSTNGTTGVVITGCQQMLSVVVYNGSDDIIVTSGNFSITQNNIVDGVLVARFNVSANPVGLQAQNWNVSYTCEPFGFDTNSGGRAISGLIIIFGMLAIAVAVLGPTLKDEILSRMNK